MTKEITKAIILQEIQDKLKLREFDPAKFLFDETIVPVYNIEPHLDKIVREGERLSITGVGSYLYYTVPMNEKWRLHRYNITFVTGVYGVSGVFVGRPSAAEYVYLDLEAGQTTSYAHDLPKDVVLFPGETIHITVDSFTSTGSLDLVIDATREEIR